MFCTVLFSMIISTVKLITKKNFSEFEFLSWGVFKSFVSIQPPNWTSYAIRFWSYVTIWSRNGSFLLHKTRADDTSKRRFLVSLWGPYLSNQFFALFALSNLFQIMKNCFIFIINFSWFYTNYAPKHALRQKLNQRNVLLHH